MSNPFSYWLRVSDADFAQQQAEDAEAVAQFNAPMSDRDRKVLAGFLGSAVLPLPATTPVAPAAPTLPVEQALSTINQASIDAANATINRLALEYGRTAAASSGSPKLAFSAPIQASAPTPALVREMVHAPAIAIW